MGAPEIIVTPLEDESSPFLAAFNIKCTTYNDPTRGAVDECYYGANYKKDFILEANREGSSYFSLAQSQPFTDAEIKMIYTVNVPESLVGGKIVLTKDSKNYATVTYDITTAGDILVEMGIASGEMTAPITVQVFDADGNALTVNAGNSWIAFVPENHEKYTEIEE
jgi:hypothetical protein